MVKSKHFFVLMCALLLLNLNVFAQGKLITVNFKNVAASTALQQIEKQSGLKMRYAFKDVKFNVTYSASKADALQVVRSIVEPHGLTVSQDKKYIVIRRSNAAPKSGLHRTISGRVRDYEGELLVGVPVYIGETHASTVTDANGFYTFQIPVEETSLRFSYVGMETTYVNIKAGSSDVTKDVTLQHSAKLNDVVVTGIFNKAKESYTGAVTTISQEELSMHKGQNLLQTLKTIDASMNFQVNNVAGSNPNNLPQINIRGNSSLPMSVQEFNETTSNEVNTPLIILDGFEITLERLMDYNDEEIESINILKDAAATAIYGSRGSNGVIVVTTRKPEPGKLRLNAEVGIDIEAPDLTSYDYLNAQEKLQLENSLGLYNDAYSASKNYEYQRQYYKKLNRVLSGSTTDWISKPVHTGIGSHYNFRLEGGSQEFRWAVTANYKDTEGAMRNSSRKSFNGAIQLMYTYKNLLFKNYTSFGHVSSRESNYGSFSQYVALEPYDSPYNEDGSLRQYLEGFYGNELSTGTANPLYDASLNTIDKSKHETLTNNFAIEWNISKDFRLRGQLGISKLNNTSDYFLPAEHSYFTTDAYGHLDEYSTDEGFLRRGLYRYGTGEGMSYDGNLTFSYNHVFAEKHQLYVGADYSVSQSNSTSYLMVAEGISNSDNPFFANASQYEQDGTPSGSKAKTRRLGFTGNVNYTFNSRYFVDLSYRVDGSSTFGSKKRWAPFWSTGIGWNVHNEKFLKNNEIINILRLKASIGETGSQTGSSSGANTIYKSVTDNRYMNWMGSTLTSWGNPSLTWQTTKERNVGVEFGFLKGLIKGEFNYYDNETTNLLSTMDLPASMGIDSYVANVGAVRNRGWELSMSVFPIRDLKHNFTWLITGQMVYNKNWISKLSDAVKAQTEAYKAQDVEVSNLFYEGMPQNAIYAVKSYGVDPSTGNEMYIDKDGNITDTWKAGDKVFCGQSDPKYRGNFSNVLRYKGWTLNFTFSYYWGGYTYNQTLIDKVEISTDALKTQNVDRRALTDRWMEAGDNTFFKGFSNETTRATSRFVMKDNVLELSSASLQYRLDTKWIRKCLKMQSVTFGINASDLIHWGSVKQERGTSYPYARNIQGSIKLLF